MDTTTAKSSLSSRVLKTELVAWRQLKFLQANSFKALPDEAKQHLKTSLIQNNFTQPFYVWQDPATGDIYCLDGKHRTQVLEELSDKEFYVPEQMPATFIDCRDKKEAAALVLIYSSMYAKITQQGLFDFIQAYDLAYAELKEQVDIPDFSMPRFEQKFNLYTTDGAEEPEVQIPEADVLVQAGDIFEINGHRIACGSFKDEYLVNELMQGKKARILNCDPPYNLPANFFLKDNKKTHNHKDFAMGAGEMTDEEFVQFLATIMQSGLRHTLPGAIHYIFMDWRHSWHMTEAARRTYGSPIPKQVCVWNKDLMANGSFYRAKHEMCFIFSNEQAKALWNKDLIDKGGSYKDNNELVFIFKAGNDDVKHLSHLDLKDRIRTNVWNYPSATSLANPDRYELKNHPTPKPVQMIADAILDSTNEGDIVIDWFLGSGTCLVASQHTGRLCYATEIEPRYVQQDIKRYLNYCAKRGIEVKFTHTNGELTYNHFSNETVTT